MQYAVFVEEKLVDICPDFSTALARADKAGGSRVHILDENRNEVMFIKKGNVISKAVHR
ncbi:MAG: hypothetical protein QXS81_01360 [Candidatus Micrarchaeaceae archaeon]